MQKGREINIYGRLYFRCWHSCFHRFVYSFVLHITCVCVWVCFLFNDQTIQNKKTSKQNFTKDAPKLFEKVYLFCVVLNECTVHGIFTKIIKI